MSKFVSRVNIANQQRCSRQLLSRIHCSHLMARLSAKKGKNGPRLPSKLDTRNEKVVNAKRQDYKGKGKARMNSDVYDYEPEKMRRGNVKMMLDDDEMQGAGLGSGEDEESSGEGPSRGEPRLIDDEGELGSEDDEEIDSDDAFGESDEDRFAGYSFSHKVCMLFRL